MIFIRNLDSHIKLILFTNVTINVGINGVDDDVKNNAGNRGFVVVATYDFINNVVNNFLVNGWLLQVG